MIIRFNKRFKPFRENTFHHINLVREKFEKRAVVTNFQHNGKKRNASTVTTTTNSLHNNKKHNASTVTPTTNSQHYDKK
jgi:hypothetical protein